MTEFTDEYFLHLTMDYDHRDDNIYPKWAVWCAKSDDKYFIDGKDHQFYTHVRTDVEIAIEKKKRSLLEFTMEERMKLEPMDKETEEKFMRYEDYIRENSWDDSKVLEFEPKTFEEWSKEQ